MPFKPGDVVRAKAGTWNVNYTDSFFLVLEVAKDDLDDVDLRDVMDVSGEKYILLDHIRGGRLHAYESELEGLE